MSASIEEVLSKLGAFQPRGLPILSIYVNTEAGGTGRANIVPYLRRELNRAVNSFPEGSPQRVSAEADGQRILDYVETDLKPETNTLVMFVAHELGVFEDLQLNARGTENRVYATWRPQIYPLLLLQDTTPRCAVVHVDRRNARILVIGAHGVMDQEKLSGERVSHVKAGGWSQARYQRRVEEISAAHLKEVVGHLVDICRLDGIESIVLAGDDVIVPQFREMLPRDLAGKVIDSMRLENHAPDKELAERARQALQEHDAETDKSTVKALTDAARAGGLGVLGHKDTHEALQRGQVSQLVISSALRDKRPSQAEAFARMAIETGAKVTFIEDAELLTDSDGVGALLRFRVEPVAQAS